MPVVVWLRILGGDLVETTKDQIADVNADMGETFRQGSIRDRVGQIDWTDAARTAASKSGALIGKGLGGVLKVGGPMIILTIAEWFLDGALQMLGTEAGKPAADALAQLGDALLDVIAKVITPLVPYLVRYVKAIIPVMLAIIDLSLTVLPVYSAMIDIWLAVAELELELLRSLARGLAGIGRALGGAWALIHNALRRSQKLIDDLVAGVSRFLGDVLGFILGPVLGPLKEHLDNLSNAWDAFWASEDTLRHPFGYMWNDVYYEWGTGPLGEAPHDQAPGGRVVVHEASERQLVAGLRAYARDNGGLSRALWGPA